MKLKASPELCLLVGLLTIALTIIPVFIFVGWWKWLIAAVFLAGGSLLENRIERAWRANPKYITK